MKNRLLIAAATWACAGCAYTTSVTGVGPDTYFVSAQAAPVRGGASAARPMALREAAGYCQGLGKQILVKSIDGADITFRCLSEGDPELKRPDTIGRRADITIERK